ncbi:plasmid replication protein, CyRepA1 family [Cyanothece sp. BG0011]|uniref:plasmid replication protein, CyRepA1 family n=1 Tax=Cyanothece sp. BG0011 TaxID=2082950 RepID=UPI0013006287|nr:plasmid replication protein, CyRepA1 family [Cyanothece sp. BG0011]
MIWLRYNRQTPCPVCNGERRDCRQNTSTNLVYCRSSEANPLDYLYRGQDPWGFNLWAYKPDAEKWADERRQEWLKEQGKQGAGRREQGSRERRSREQGESLEKLLSIPERDQVIREILGQLTLSQTHGQILRERGISDRQITEGNYRSITKWQRLRKPVDIRLSGVNHRGDKLNNPCDGILIPVPDENGLYTGLRINNLTPQANELGKYLWLSSKNSRGIPIDLPSGELPIATYLPQEAPEKEIIGFCEGLEYKPLLASSNVGIPIIGASGGNFGSSTKAIEAAIASIKQRYGWEKPKFVLYADAGSIINPNVAIAYEKLGKIVPNLKVVDWGQLTDKETGLDIDELDDQTIEKIKLAKSFRFSLQGEGNVKLITIKQFLKKAKSYQKKKLDPRIKKIQKDLRSLTYAPDIQLTQKDLIDGKYLPSDLLIELMPKQGIINLKSAKGSGKSHLNENLIKQLRTEGYKIISIVPRIVLGRGQAQAWGIEWQIDTDDPLCKQVNRLTIYENQATLGLCFDSIWKLYHRNLEKTAIFLDEAELGLTHLLASSTCKEKRSLLLKSFQKIINEVLSYKGLVLLSDADLTDVSIDYIRSLAPTNTSVFTIVNHEKPLSYKAYILNQKKWIKQEALNAIEAGQKIIIATDSQAEAEKMERELHKRFPDKIINRIDSKTVEDQWGKDYVERVNESIKKERPDILIYTPSMSTGTSIDGKINGKIDHEVKHWFDKVFGIFVGVLTPSQCRQALMRYRANVPRYIYIRTAGMIRGNRSFDPVEINKSLHEYHKEGLSLLDVQQLVKLDDPVEYIEKLLEMVDCEKRQWSNVHITAYCNFKARDNFGLANLREIFTQELIDEGHEVIKINTNGCEVLLQTKEFMEGETEQGKAIHRETASAIANSGDITLEAAQSIMRKATATATERHQATKAFIGEEIPGVELTPEFIEKNVVRDRRRSLNAIKLYWKLLNPDAAQYYDEKEYSHKFRQFATHSIVYLPDIRAYYPLVKELLDLGILEVLANPDKEYTQDDSWLEEFKQKCLRRRNRLYQLFDIIVTKKSKAIHLLNRFLDKIGLGFICEQKRVNGERVRTYKLDPEKLNNSDRNAILNAFDLKWGQTVTRYGLEGVTELPENSYTINQQETSVTVENNGRTETDYRTGFSLGTENVVQVGNPQDQLENEEGQSQSPQSLGGVTELARTRKTNNQEETNVTEDLKPFWWPYSSDRYSPDFELTVHTAYWWLLAAESFEGLELAKAKITQLSHKLGWGSHQLLNWLFERMPDDAIDYVEGLMAI